VRGRRPGVTALVGVLTTIGVGTVAASEPADVCLEVTPGVLSAPEWSSVADSVAAALEPRGALFPDPQVATDDALLVVHSGHDGLARGADGCLRDGFEWTARFGRDFLEAGADQMLAEAPTTPGIASDVTIEWYPEDARLRTTLVFAGPLDIPNGRCWVDDALTVDAAAGTVVASGEEGLETSPFAEAACGRFFDHLPEGGAGEQAVTLLPRSVVLADATVLRFVAEEVLVADDAVSVSGHLARD